jgi:hypothetical protein
MLLISSYRILRYWKAALGKPYTLEKPVIGMRLFLLMLIRYDPLHIESHLQITCTYVWGNLVTWRSKKQSVVARRSAEVEIRAMAQGICEGLWIHRVLKELKMTIELTLKLYCENKDTISLADNSVQHDRTKHIEIDRHFIKEKIDS